MIKSSVDAAQEAVSGFKAVDERWQVAPVEMTSIEGVKTALKASNRLHHSLVELKIEALKQKERFFELAATIEARDQADAAQLSGGICKRA